MDLLSATLRTIPINTWGKLSVTNGAPITDVSEFRSLNGALQTCLDLVYMVQQVCLLMHDPHETHRALIKYILRYVKGTLSTSLHIITAPVQFMKAYSDAD